MDYEKLYKEALSRARQFSEHPLQEDSDSIVEYIFPELKESEDEKIRKTLIRFHKSTIDVDGIKGEDIIAWLENLNLIKANSPQLGEQKTTDKVESKFHEGDWVILTAGELSTTLQIVSVDINKKLYWFNDSSYLPIVDEECLHHWTIQDAKGGDVLSDGTTIFIFKDLLSDGSVMSYCDYDTDSGESDAFCPLSANLMCSKITPATKEQCDTLFAKMKEAGYEWNAEKKVLKEIEHKPTIKVEPKFKVGDWISGYYRYYKVLSLNNDGYVVEDVDGDKINILFENEKFHHLFTIADAKDGDVLCCESGWTCIFKTLNSDNISFSSYCFMDNTGWFCETGSESHTLEKAFIKAYNGEIYPATKEQRDTLEKAMTDAGYTFNFESKELRKIEKPIEWSYEDEANLNNIIWLCNNCIKGTETTWIPSQATKIKHLIETIKEEGLAQQNPAWSEEDMSKVQRICKYLNEAKKYYADITEVRECMDWLKSLKQRIGG